MASFGGEKVREIMSSEPVKLSHKISVWASGVWNCCDAFFVIEFFIAMVFRLQEDTLEIGRVLYCLNIVFWYDVRLHVNFPAQNNICIIYSGT
jgi:transient receptor potential cation channel subfamily M protein 3